MSAACKPPSGAGHRFGRLAGRRLVLFCRRCHPPAPSRTTCRPSIRPRWRTARMAPWCRWGGSRVLCTSCPIPPPRWRTPLEAQRLVELRDRWLNAPEWVEWLDEPVPGYPKRPVPRDEDAAKGAREAHADEPLQRRAAMARRCARDSWTRLWLPRTVGRRTSPTTKFCASCWR